MVVAVDAAKKIGSSMLAIATEKFTFLQYKDILGM